ncbi:MAG: hypothetical protein PHU53_00925 [Thermoplasmata archaeon]|nr:hypothetical protein [Thermoplasmata archaeon]
MIVPHVVLTGNFDIPRIPEIISRISFRSGTAVLKTGVTYIAPDSSAIIIESTSVESGKPLNFLILINRRNDGLVIRLHPSLDIEKTEGVKRLLALVANSIIAANPGSAVGKTNLQEFL